MDRTVLDRRENEQGLLSVEFKKTPDVGARNIRVGVGEHVVKCVIV